VAGYFTDSRDKVLNKHLTIIKDGFGHSGLVNFDPIHQTQTTTSFRSRSESDDQMVAEADKIYLNGFKELSSPFDTGHEFYSIDHQFSMSHENGHLSGGDFILDPEVQGALLIDQYGGFPLRYPDVGRLSDTDIAFYGHKAIANTVPTSPSAQFGDFITQTVLTKRPNLVGDLEYFRNVTGAAREAGRQYINLEFGWAPMISDLKGILNDVLNSYKLIKMYQRGSGKTTRRSFHFDPVIENSQNFQIGARLLNCDEHLFQGGNPFGTVTLYSGLHQNIWFKGAYVYFLNFGQALPARMERYASLAQQLLGLKLTPAVLWDLVPWSWLADWRLDLTSMLNINSDLSTDNLVIKYGYLMRLTKAYNSYALTELEPKFGDRGPYVNTYSVVQKERVKATPYGFGVDPGQFTLSQLAILASLGITRGILK